jgi:hypothetical protein
MKKSILVILLLLFFSKIHAQTPTIDINAHHFDEVENAYYKDIENFYNQFEGTWVYTDATQIIRLRFVKKEMVSRNVNTSFYADYLIGEMEYIMNEIEIFNSLPNLNITYSDIWKYNLVSIKKVGNNIYPICTECPSDVKRLSMKYDEPTNNDLGLEAEFVMRIEIENGAPKLKVQYIIVSGPIGINKNNFDSPSTTTNFTIPYGNYTFVKED